MLSWLAERIWSSVVILHPTASGLRFPKLEKVWPCPDILEMSLHLRLLTQAGMSGISSAMLEPEEAFCLILVSSLAHE